MTLAQLLATARTEEDVKDAYIKALGLKSVFKGLVDIQTPEIWFEAKEAPTPPLLMFAQLLTYVRAARKRGEAMPRLPKSCGRWFISWGSCLSSVCRRPASRRRSARTGDCQGCGVA